LLDLQTQAVHDCPIGRGLRVGRVAPTLTVDLQIPDPTVSRRHCVLTARPDGSLKIDDYSSAGTFVNGRRIQGSGVAYTDDVITLAERYQLKLLPAAKVDPFIGQVVGERYRIRKELGRGGMGIVYGADDAERQQPCALKVLLAVEAEAARRFQREARLATLLGEHPGVVKVYDFGYLPEGEPFLVMEFVLGRDLADIIEAGVKLHEGVGYVAQAARILSFAHRQGIVHRDLKPENLLVTPEGQVRVTDFGIAKLRGSKLTGTGMALGTPCYVAPEQILDSKRVTEKADVFGLGGILYAVLTGHPPYEGPDLAAILAKSLKGDLVPPRHYAPGVDPTLEALCVRALKVEPDARPNSALFFAEALESWLGSEA
jgi:serine/threonine protein kinase